MSTITAPVSTPWHSDKNPDHPLYLPVNRGNKALVYGASVREHPIFKLRNLYEAIISVKLACQMCGKGFIYL